MSNEKIQHNLGGIKRFQDLIKKHILSNTITHVFDNYINETHCLESLTNKFISRMTSLSTIKFDLEDISQVLQQSQYVVLIDAYGVTEMDAAESCLQKLSAVNPAQLLGFKLVQLVGSKNLSLETVQRVTDKFSVLQPSVNSLWAFDETDSEDLCAMRCILGSVDSAS